MSEPAPRRFKEWGITGFVRIARQRELRGHAAYLPQLAFLHIFSDVYTRLRVVPNLPKNLNCNLVILLPWRIFESACALEFHSGKLSLPSMLRLRSLV